MYKDGHVLDYMINRSETNSFMKSHLSVGSNRCDDMPSYKVQLSVCLVSLSLCLSSLSHIFVSTLGIIRQQTTLTTLPAPVSRIYKTHQKSQFLISLLH